MIFFGHKFGRKLCPALIALVALAALAACGSPQDQFPPIAVTFDPEFPPPSALSPNATTGIAADVANDIKNAGVNFTCSPAIACGAFSPATIASAVPTTYQAPAKVPASGKVTVTATSVTDPTKSVTATISID